jgi:putative CocE/NonD family hydrolase
MLLTTDDPLTVREIEHVWIPLSDGTRLAARVWLPDDADEHPVPAVLEYIPYRKNDGTASRDVPRLPELASNGYAAVRVDLRGSGDSDGLMLDEYLQQELDDACQVIDWLSRQSWCSGSVGMWGKSWGGFNALQVAALRPRSLKAIISVCSTDDRYADDVHYRGGCVVGADMLSWASTMLVYGARPPDPKHVGDPWRQAWLERLQVTPFVESWLAHQRRDDYWRHGSVCEDFGQMDCAVYMVGGWDDGYQDAILRVLEGYEGPRKGLIGPWGHTFPDQGRPGDPIDFIAESVRFWDHWLKEDPNGVMEEPMLRAFLVESTNDQPTPAERNGGWVSEPTWPSEGISEQRWVLGSYRLGEQDPTPERHNLIGSQSAGIEAGAYISGGAPSELPVDQRREDGAALTYTSDPLSKPLTVLGAPTVDLEVEVDRPEAAIAVRLCEVTATGASRLVARGLLNLTHRASHKQLSPMIPGERTCVTVHLSAVGRTFKAGSRLRVAVSPTYWPWMWPSPEPVTLGLHTGERSALNLPVRSPRPDDGEPPAFVLTAVEPSAGSLDSAERTVYHDIASGRWVLTVRSSEKKVERPDGLRLIESATDEFTIVEGDPLSAQVRCDRTSALQRGTWIVRMETCSTMSADRASFYVTNNLDAFEGNTRVLVRSWTKRIPRDRV